MTARSRKLSMTPGAIGMRKTRRRQRLMAEYALTLAEMGRLYQRHYEDLNFDAIEEALLVLLADWAADVKTNGCDPLPRSTVITESEDD